MANVIIAIFILFIMKMFINRMDVCPIRMDIDTCFIKIENYETKQVIDFIGPAQSFDCFL